MFYIKKFFYILIKFPVRGGVFFILTNILIMSIHHYDFFQKRIDRHFEDLEPTLYFWALIEGNSDLKEPTKKLEKLPGIKKIILKNEGQTRKNIEIGLQDLDLELPQFYLEKRFRGLKIILEHDLEQRSQKLIRGYIVRIFGKDKVTLGPMKLISPMNSKTGPLSAKFFREWSYFILVFLIFTAWSIGFLGLYPLVGNISFIVENFQRRSNVKFKILAQGLFSMLMFITLISLVMGKFSLVGCLVLVLIFTLFSFINLKNIYD